MLGLKKQTIDRPYAVIVYGVEGVGKTTFGAEAPAPIFIGPERGTDRLNVYRFETPHEWSNVLRDLSRLEKEPHEAKTLVVDSLDWLEPLVIKEMLSRHPGKTMKSVAGGFGAGSDMVLPFWREFMERLNTLRDRRGMNIILIAHADAARFKDPAVQAEYFRYQLKLDKKTALLFKEFADAVLFATYETFVDEEGTMTKAIGKGKRIIQTEHRPGWDAKNRFGLPATMAFNYADFAKAIRPDTASSMIEKIEVLKARVTDPAKLPKIEEAIKAAGQSVKDLKTIHDRLLATIPAEAQIEGLEA